MSPARVINLNAGDTQPWYSILSFMQHQWRLPALNGLNALSLDPALSGPVTLTVTPPAHVPPPAGFPGTVTLTNGRGSFVATFGTAGYYRIAATGPGGSRGWTTVDVGVTPNTVPTP